MGKLLRTCEYTCLGISHLLKGGGGGSTKQEKVAKSNSNPIQSFGVGFFRHTEIDLI